MVLTSFLFAPTFRIYFSETISLSLSRCLVSQVEPTCMSSLLLGTTPRLQRNKRQVSNPVSVISSRVPWLSYQAITTNAPIVASCIMPWMVIIMKDLRMLF